MSEQRVPKSPERLAAQPGRAAWDEAERGEELSEDEFADYCRHLDPTNPKERPRRRYR